MGNELESRVLFDGKEYFCLIFMKKDEKAEIKEWKDEMFDRVWTNHIFHLILIHFFIFVTLHTFSNF